MDDRVVDLDPEFQMKDPWVTREFRVFDLLAQRSGFPPLVNDMLAMTGFDEAALIRSLRDVEPVSSFRTTFAYTNITHLLASRIVAKAANAADWNTVLRQDLLDPLNMEELVLYGRSHRSRGRSCERPPLVAGRCDRDAIHPDFPLSLGWGRGHQLKRRGYVALGSPADRRRQFRGALHHIAGKSSLYAHA